MSRTFDIFAFEISLNDNPCKEKIVIITGYKEAKHYTDSRPMWYDKNME